MCPRFLGVTIVEKHRKTKLTTSFLDFFFSFFSGMLSFFPFFFSTTASLLFYNTGHSSQIIKHTTFQAGPWCWPDSGPAIFWMAFIDFRRPLEKEGFWVVVYYIDSFWTHHINFIIIFGIYTRCQ